MLNNDKGFEGVSHEKGKIFKLRGEILLVLVSALLLISISFLWPGWAKTLEINQGPFLKDVDVFISKSGEKKFSPTVDVTPILSKYIQLGVPKQNVDLFCIENKLDKQPQKKTYDSNKKILVWDSYSANLNKQWPVVCSKALHVRFNYTDNTLKAYNAHVSLVCL